MLKTMARSFNRDPVLVEVPTTLGGQWQRSNVDGGGVRLHARLPLDH